MSAFRLLIFLCTFCTIISFHADFRIATHANSKTKWEIAPQFQQGTSPLSCVSRPTLVSAEKKLSTFNALERLRGLATDGLRRIKMLGTLIALIISTIAPRLGAPITAAAIAGSGLFAVPKVAHAGILKRYTKLSPMQKLSTTPLFFVCNSGGSPYLQDDIQAGKPTQRIIVYFMSSEDANDYLQELAQGSPNPNEVRVKTTSMEKIMNNIMKKKQSRKLGRFPMATIYRIQPSSRQCENAEKVAGAGNSALGAKAMKGVSIPMFCTQGLAIQRSTGEMLTPYYFAYEDLLDDWSKIVSEAKEKGSTKVPSAPKVIVKDFTEVMCLSQGITTDSVSPKSQGALDKAEQSSEVIKAKKVTETVGVVPPRREIEMIKNFYKKGAGMNNEFAQARIIGPPR